MTYFYAFIKKWTFIFMAPFVLLENKIPINAIAGNEMEEVASVMKTAENLGFPIADYGMSFLLIGFACWFLAAKVWPAHLEAVDKKDKVFESIKKSFDTLVSEQRKLNAVLEKIINCEHCKRD